ncbi:hypothetical protein FALCPG4_000873 [Fusarium falciforme]
MSSTSDFAFSTYGWVYRTSRDSRKPNTIIRTYKSTEDSKTAHLTLSLEFEPRENQGWTEQDLAVTDVPQDELSVVVGELLPAGYKESVSEEKMRLAKYYALFDPNVHDSIDRSDPINLKAYCSYPSSTSLPRTPGDSNPPRLWINLFS